MEVLHKTLEWVLVGLFEALLELMSPSVPVKRCLIVFVYAPIRFRCKPHNVRVAQRDIIVVAYKLGW
jgi:hypothetical protein